MIVTITKRMLGLQPGAVVHMDKCDIVITSEYNDFYGWYRCSSIEYDDLGNASEIPGGIVRPSELIGARIDV